MFSLVTIPEIIQKGEITASVVNPLNSLRLEQQSGKPILQPAARSVLPAGNACFPARSPPGAAGLTAPVLRFRR